MKVITGSTR